VTIAIRFFQQLEQDRHRLRLQLEVMESEYESRVLELKQDASAARKELKKVREAAAGEGKERAALSLALREQVRERNSLYYLKKKKMMIYLRVH